MSPRHTSRLLAWLEGGLWLSAIVLLGWCAGSWLDAARYQRRHAGVIELRSSVLAPTGAAVTVAPGQPIAGLAIPRLGVDVVVAEGTSPDVLRRAAGRIASSALPGTDGNVAIAAHRDSFFRPLRSIETGDLVVLQGGAGARSYRVEWIRVVDPDAVDVIAATDYPALTLVTCYPFHYVGDAPQRFVVRARAVDGSDGASAEATAAAILQALPV